jgi:biopolymer transport protein ExbD
MKLKRPDRFPAQVSTSSLNDIMFFLLLFFLIVSTLSNPNVIKVLLPKSSSSQSINKQQINLTVTNEKTYFVDKQQVEFKDLSEVLRTRVQGLDNPTIILNAAYELNLQDVIDVLEIGTELNVKMVIATKKRH